MVKNTCMVPCIMQREITSYCLSGGLDLCLGNCHPSCFRNEMDSVLKSKLPTPQLEGEDAALAVDTGLLCFGAVTAHVDVFR